MSAVGRRRTDAHRGRLANVARSSDNVGPYVAGLGRLEASGYPVVDGFIVRATGDDARDRADTNGIGREEIATQLAALELRQGRRLGDELRPLRLSILALPRALEVPIDHDPGRPSAAAASYVVAEDVRTARALVDAVRVTAAAHWQRTIVVLVLPDEQRVTFVGTLMTRDAADGSISTHSSWSRPTGAAGAERGVVDEPPREQRVQCDRIAEAAEAACADMCCVSVAIVDETPTVVAITPAARTPLAALRVAVDLRDHGLITATEALRRVPLAPFAPGAVHSASSSAATDVSRLLGWAERIQRVPLVAAPAPTLATVRIPADVAALSALTADVLIEPTGDPSAVSRILHEVADALDARGIERAVLLLNDHLRAAASTALPSLPWHAVVGVVDDPSARVLAARLEGVADDAGAPTRPSSERRSAGPRVVARTLLPPATPTGRRRGRRA